MSILRHQPRPRSWSHEEFSTLKDSWIYTSDRCPDILHLQVTTTSKYIALTGNSLITRFPLYPHSPHIWRIRRREQRPLEHMEKLQHESTWSCQDLFVHSPCINYVRYRLTAHLEQTSSFSSWRHWPKAVEKIINSATLFINLYARALETVGSTSTSPFYYLFVCLFLLRSVIARLIDVQRVT